LAKYKKKKSAPESETQLQKSSSMPKVAPLQIPAPGTSSEKKPKRLASGSLKLQFAGDLILVKNPQRSLSGLFKRYAALFEALANLPKDQRGLVYKIMTGLMLTSHAKKAISSDEKRRLFELKNQLFLAIANDRSLRRQVEFKYLVSKNFRVSSYCESCQKSNAELGLDRHKWKYCKSCNVDHNFYNLLSLEARFPQGFARIFISNDQIPKIDHFKMPRKIKADLLKEEAMIDQFHYNTRNLDAIDLESITTLHQKLMVPAAEPTATKKTVKKSEKTPV
jgi:hypothetical protein